MNQQAIADRPASEERAARARIDAAGKLLRGGKSDVPDDFVALLFGRAAPEDLVGYEAGRARGAGPRGLGVSRRAQARRAENPLRAAASLGRRPPEVDLGDRDRQRRHAVPGRFGDGRTDRARPRRRGWSRIRSSRSSATRPASSTARRSERGSDKATARESFIHIHVERIDDAQRRAEIVAGAGAGAGRGAALRAGLEADARPRRRGRSRSSRPIRRRCRSTTSPRRSSSWNGWPPTTSRCSACATTRFAGKDRDLKPVHGHRSWHAARRRRAGVHARRPGRDRHAGRSAPSSTSRRR